MLYTEKMSQSSKEVKQAWLARNKHKRPDINKNWTIRNVYGLTSTQYQEMLEQQKGECAICRIPFVGFKEEPKQQRVHIDHDHSSKWVRGLLCGNCNFGIGHLGDDIGILQNAIEYIVANTTPTEFVFSKVPNPPRKPNNSKPRTAEWNQNISDSKKGNSPAWNAGKSWNTATRQKMSASATKRWSKDKQQCQDRTPR